MSAGVVIGGWTRQSTEERRRESSFLLLSERETRQPGQSSGLKKRTQVLRNNICGKLSHRGVMRSITIIAAFVFLTGFTQWGQAEVLFDENLAWRLANPGEIRRITNIRARLRKESNKAEPLFVLTPPPFDDIAAAPNKLGNKPVVAKSWEVPPWPTVDPALPKDISPQTLRILEARRNEYDEADVWGELAPAGQAKKAPSFLLRPRVVPVDQQFVFRIKEIPEPFSLRRYFDRKDVFIEIAAYGGTTSFKAEEAFRALKEAATKQTKLEGIGREAFLTRIEITDEDPNEDPNAMPFADVEPSGEARPDLLDSSVAEAMTAPAFSDLPVKDLEGKRIKYVEPSKRGRSQDPKVLQSFLIVVAFFPDDAVTVTLALEERLGSVQDLLRMAMMVQSKLKYDIDPRS